MAILLNYFRALSVKAWKQVCTYTRIIKCVGIRKPDKIWKPRRSTYFESFNFQNCRLIWENERKKIQIFQALCALWLAFLEKLLSGTPDHGSGQFDTFHIFSSTG